MLNNYEHSVNTTRKNVKNAQNISKMSWYMSQVICECVENEFFNSIWRTSVEYILADELILLEVTAMPTVINADEKKRTPVSHRSLSSVLPPKLYEEVLPYLSGNRRAEEIRCRQGRHSYITVLGENLELNYVTDKADMERMLLSLLGGSLYAHRETLLEGFVTLEGGLRVGICGRAVLDNKKISGIYDVTSLNFRLPAAIYSASSVVEGLLRKGRGVLVYSPPGVGKTTLLRSIVGRLARGRDCMRVCVVDTRGELSMCEGALGDSDILLGYPKGEGIEIATRCMSPQLIVCDEIGSDAEAAAIESATNCGVPILAAAHGDSVSSLFRRGGILRLHRAAVFSYYVGLERGREGLEFEITSAEDIGDIS